MLAAVSVQCVDNKHRTEQRNGVVQCSTQQREYVKSMSNITVTLHPYVSPASSSKKITFLLDEKPEPSPQPPANTTAKSSTAVTASSQPLSTKPHTTSVLHVQIPPRPTFCNLNALVYKLWGCWAQCAVEPPPDLRTANEKTYRVTKAIGHDNGSLEWGHSAIVSHFLPSLTEIRSSNGVPLCRASLAFDKKRKESKIPLKNGVLLHLFGLEPHAMLKTRQKEMENIMKKQEIARKKGKTVKIAKRSTAMVVAATAPSTTGSTTKTGTKKLTRKQRWAASTAQKKQIMINKQKEEEANEEDQELLLLQAIMGGMFTLTVQFVVGGQTVSIGPVSIRHVVADVAVLLERQTGIQIKHQRLMFHGVLLNLHSMLGDIGIKNTSINDVFFLTVVDAHDFVEEEEDNTQEKQELVER